MSLAGDPTSLRLNNAGAMTSPKRAGKLETRRLTNDSQEDISKHESSVFEEVVEHELPTAVFNYIGLFFDYLFNSVNIKLLKGKSLFDLLLAGQMILFWECLVERCMLWLLAIA